MRTSLVLLASLFCIGLAVADEETARAEMAKRLQPVGEVNQKVQVAQTAAPAAATPAATPAVAKKSGEDIYNGKCMACHSSGVAGAPKKADAKDWQPRVVIAGKGPAALDGLLKVALAGKNAMPPKGTCMDCSDDELKAAIQYMVPAELLK